MKPLKSPIILALACLAAAPAAARPQPNPPPSGIVVHLFGPDSVTSKILSAGPAAPGTAQATSLPAAPGDAAAAPASSPGWGAMAHKLFVTGDPATEGAAALPKGKMGQH